VIDLCIGGYCSVTCRDFKIFKKSLQKNIEVWTSVDNKRTIQNIQIIRIFGIFLKLFILFKILTPKILKLFNYS